MWKSVSHAVPLKRWQESVFSRRNDSIHFNLAKERLKFVQQWAETFVFVRESS